MSKSLIRKNQLHPDINDLVGQYGSGYFTSINNLITTGQVLQNQLNTAVYITGSQTVGGIKNFSSRLSVNGTGVLLSGEAAQLPSTLLYTTGNQTISGNKNFIIRPTFSGLNLITTGDLVDLELDIMPVSLVVPNSVTSPSNPQAGQIFFDTVNNNFSGYNGTIWTKLNN
jgi:hypothetical protein